MTDMPWTSPSQTRSRQARVSWHLRSEVSDCLNPASLISETYFSLLSGNQVEAWELNTGGKRLRMRIDKQLGRVHYRGSQDTRNREQIL